MTNSSAKHGAYRPWAAHTVVVRLSRKLTATYRLRSGRVLSQLLTAMLAGISTLATALPEGASLVAGQANISTPNANAMVITQGSDKAILNWQSFNIGTGQSMQFVQPGAASVALNRVTGAAPSSIYGSLSANGQVFLINPAGVMFAPGAQVHVGGLVASTLALSNEDFMAGRYTFSSSGNAGAVTNGGNIRAARGGYVLLAAPNVSNTGSINADTGSVGLVAGARVSVDTSGAGLVSFSVDAAAANAVAANSGVITAQGGQVAVLASALGDVMATVINQTGVIRATSATERNGLIVLSGGATGVVRVSGTLDASGADAGLTGGKVHVLGDKVALEAGASIDVSGSSGGGAALVGGDYQGSNAAIQNASRTYIATGATVRADATNSGSGGKVIVWADGDTRYRGTISARGGAAGGDGGFVEVSGKQQLDLQGRIDVAAPVGTGGRVLLDPQDIRLDATAQPSPPNNPNGTPDVAFADAPAAGIYTIQVADVIGYSELHLQATNNITLASALSMTSGNSVKFEAGNTVAINAALTASGGVSLSGANVTSTAAGVITSSGAGNTNAGNVSINATGSVNLAGNIVANGGTASAGNPGRDGGVITITGAGVALGAATLTASGTTGSGAGQPGGTGGSINVTSTNGISGTGAITASGGSGGTGNSAGGNAGVITITNSGAGNITTGALTASTGAAVGTGAGGTAGSISVSNTAAGADLSTGAISTAGGAGGNGGAVTLASQAGVTVTSTLNTSGTALAAGTRTGSNAGNVTITGVNRSITGAITASGSAANGANLAGGNAGVVSITGSGTLNTAAITAQTGLATGTGASGAVGSITLSASNAVVGALTTGGVTTVPAGSNGHGGAVSITTTGTLSAGAITTSGGIAIAGNAGRNAGNVTLNAGGAITALGAVSASGSAGRLTGDQAGGNAGVVSITAVGGIAAGAITASGGAAAGTNAAGGNAGSITVANSGAGNITTGALAAQTGNALGTGAGGTAGFISVTNSAAAGNLTTAGVTTTGGTKGHGGNINLSALGALSTGAAGNINAAGGTTITGNAGRNAGSITLSGASVSTGTGTITASGTAGLGTNQNGGNGADVQITSSGAITTGAISSAGSSAVGVAGPANGGNAGNITVTNNSATAGAIALGGLTSTGGAAFGTGTGGTTGTIAVTNNAAGQALGVTGAINAAGATNANGASVTLASQGNATVSGLINTSGGARGTGSVAAGTSAGNVTITGVNRSVTGTITASGGAGLGTNQAGGNAGVVSLTGSGTLGTGAITASTGAATGTGAGGTAGSIALTGTTITTGALTTTGGSNGAGGNVSATASTGLLNVTGAIITTGGGALTNTAGRSAGMVTLTGDSVTTVAITANGTVGSGANMAGGNGAAVTVTGSGGNVSVGAISAAGATAGTGNANGGNAGNITLDAGGGVPLITLNGNLTATGGNRVGTGSAGSGGQVWVKGAATQTANIIVNTIGGTGGAGGAIRLDGALNEDATARALTLTAGTGAVTLAGGAATSAVTSLSATGASIALGSVQTKGTQIYTGATTLNGNLATLGTAGADTIALNSPVTLTGNSSLTTAGGAGDNIVLGQAINGTHSLTLNAGTSGNVTTTAGIGQTTALGAFSATGAAVSLAAVRAANILARSTTGNLTLTGAQTATGVGDSVVLVAKQNFDNAGAATINPGAGRWLVYSTNPTSDTRGGLVANFKQYNATYGDAILGTGNGYIHTVAPTVTASLTGTVTKVYDGNTNATLTAGNYSSSAGIDGDVVALNNPTTGNYADKNVGTGKSISVSGITASASNGATTVYGYQVSGGGTATGNVGTVTARALAVSATGTNKVYDATTNAVVSLSDNRVAGDVLTASNTAASFADKNVGIGKAVSVTGINVTGTDAANYSFNTTAATTADIMQRALTVTAAGAAKVYDGNANATVALADNRVAGDVLTASNTAASFADKNAGVGKAVSVTGISVSGTDAANYSFNTTAATAADITQRALTVTATGTNKVYDATTNAAVVLADNRLIGDVLTASNTSATFGDKNVGNGKAVSVTGINVTGTDAGNYNFNTAATTAADITQRALTMAATGINKVYDATTNATVVLADNRVAGDVLTASNTAASFADKNVGVGKAVNVTGINVTGVDAANYSFNTTAVTTANITPATIASVTGITANTKVADGKTTAALNTGAAGFAGMFGGDVLNVAVAIGNFDTAAPGVGKPVAITGIALGGADAGNYVLANNTASAKATLADPAGLGSAFRPTVASFATVSTPMAASAAALSVTAMNALLESSPTAAGPCADPEAACATGDSAVLVQTLREPTDQRPGIVSVNVSSERVAVSTGFRFSLPKGLMALAGEAPVEVTTLSGKPLPVWLRFEAASGEFTAAGMPSRALPQQLRIGLGSRSVVLTVSETAAAPPVLRNAVAQTQLPGG